MPLSMIKQQTKSQAIYMEYLLNKAKENARTISEDALLFDNNQRKLAAKDEHIELKKSFSKYNIHSDTPYDLNHSSRIINNGIHITKESIPMASLLTDSMKKMTNEDKNTTYKQPTLNPENEENDTSEKSLPP